jgi:asparaginyl-tRNA synthetase
METTLQTTALEKTIEKIQRTELKDILTVQQCIIRATHEYMFKKGLIQMMPLMLSPITDPLNHGVVDASIEYADKKWSLTKSMIFHKQLTLMSPVLDAIYIVSPNVRLEFADRSQTGRHLFEFTQVDFEFKGKDKEHVMQFMEELIAYVFDFLNREIPETIIKFRGGLLAVPGKLKRFRTEALETLLGKDYEHKMSLEMEEPFWLLNHKREFYDKEDQSAPGTYLNYDIIWPEGFGEGLSGGERENEYHQILKRMDETGTSKEVFAHYISLAKEGKMPQTAGAGFGVERMTRFICKLKDIDEATVFSRKPFGEMLF